jgi:hypothetical protein
MYVTVEFEICDSGSVMHHVYVTSDCDKCTIVLKSTPTTMEMEKRIPPKSPSLPSSLAHSLDTPTQIQR